MMEVDEIVERYCGAINHHDLEALCLSEDHESVQALNRTATFAGASRHVTAVWNFQPVPNFRAEIMRGERDEAREAGIGGGHGAA